MKPDGVSAEVVRVALDEVVHFIVCPELVGELRRVLARPRFRRYLSNDEAELFVAAVEAASDVAPNPKEIPKESRDPGDDYLIALARTNNVDALITGDQDLSVEGGPPTLSPRALLNKLRLGPTERQLLIVALWNLHLRIREAVNESPDPQLSLFLEHVYSAVRTLGGDPDAPVFGFAQLDSATIDLRRLNPSERTVCAYGLALDRHTTGQLHARHVEEVERLSEAFEIIDRYSTMERLLK